jgi:transposase InsO family protein
VQKGCPYDDVCIESFHAILKKEEVYHTQYTDYPATKLAMFQFIEGWGTTEIESIAASAIRHHKPLKTRPEEQLKT